jgi:uncharacterized protein
MNGWKRKMEDEKTYTAFLGTTLVHSGPLDRVLTAVKSRFDQDPGAPILLFEDQSGRQVDFDLRGTLAEVLARALPERASTGPGRPKLGVIAREVTLLPRHWEWLEQQPNGASAALRRLVDEARKRDPGAQQVRLVIEATGRFLSAMAGNFGGYEEATRALYTRNRKRFDELIHDWPEDIQLHTRRLIGDAF